MVCEFEKLIYPSSISMTDEGSFMIALYRPCERVLDRDGERMWKIKAVGYCLPMTEGLRFDMKGHWSNDPKFGLQFEVENYEDVVVPTREGITAYLSSGQIKGIGPALAGRIFDAFGTETLTVLDNEPERLLEVRGITEKKLEKITSSYLENRGARDVVSFLMPFGITAKKAVLFYREYGRKAMEIVKEHPYRLCEIDGIGFKTADQIAIKMGVPKLSPERVDEGILFTLKEQESRGHLCMEKDRFLKESLKMLATGGLTEQMAGVRASRMIYSGKLVLYKDSVYRRKAFDAEDLLAGYVKKMLCRKQSFVLPGLEEKIKKEEEALGITFAAEQKEAVRMALSTGLCIITGGPGTGKTMIQKAILDIYREECGDNIVCCAPTGRAARRMEESTGHYASTVHSALGLGAGDGISYGEEEKIPADLVITDESSMLDIYVAESLFSALNETCRLVVVGDADQLPSVGPGAVLSELIASGRIPVVRLEHVFRQAEGSLIAENAQRIKHGMTDLAYGADFRFIPSGDLAESARIIEELYLEEMETAGIDQVALLSPYRRKTETGADALNERIRDVVNPSGRTKAELSCGKKTFRKGDKVMQMKNQDDVSNGDIGYIREITKNGNELEAEVDFGDGRIKDYDASRMEFLDLGYASTIHKSQGSEYRTVIISLQSAHYVMLNRPLIYTAVTRGKKKVVIVGEKRALCMAIKKTETEKRGTNLAVRINEYMEGVVA